jgi:hypothetical protein
VPLVSCDCTCNCQAVNEEEFLFIHALSSSSTLVFRGYSNFAKFFLLDLWFFTAVSPQANGSGLRCCRKVTEREGYSFLEIFEESFPRPLVSSVTRIFCYRALAHRFLDLSCCSCMAEL